MEVDGCRSLILVEPTADPNTYELTCLNDSLMQNLRISLATQRVSLFNFSTLIAGHINPERCRILNHALGAHSFLENLVASKTPIIAKQSFNTSFLTHHST